jgi:secreted trypsin-like serine protease
MSTGGPLIMRENFGVVQVGIFSYGNNLVCGSGEQFTKFVTIFYKNYVSI